MTVLKHVGSASKQKDYNKMTQAMHGLYLVHASGIARLWINLKSLTNNKKSIC